MNVLVILQGPAYGDERAYNGLRLAGQKLPDGYYHLDRMLTSAARHGTEIGLCGTCMDARGLTDEMLIPEARRSTLDEATDWTLWADKAITF